MSSYHDTAIEHLSQQFRDYRPQFSTRPDGTLLISLRNTAGKRLISRVIQHEEQSSSVLLNDLVERIRRDLMTVEGPLEEVNVEWFLKRIELQTFIPLNPTHRPRKVVVAGARLRAQAGKHARQAR
ncbi:DUF3509 domain-containing protein [Pseudomonas sp. GD04087]|uniref:DUF3509 domain-containing protein n=1 Tax=unclassified Pseudomonas TaxID=196821 RepID=UPI00244C3BA6|nr:MULTISPECIES: DUF3509 domain-containing protein [unclassified Pseudomonas]MDH0288171.1 DUF3509 domain-containing protein [Pseudomonas sp. GD04087]MDH1049006.1 DUF3509 domain-containing protein [Pseudomonas sp. GD03903]MDH1999557.1 DUF3509 domain-containing protein [Pseudomonas sp. GD03691]